MRDDHLLHDLGQAAREGAIDDFSDPRWDALSAGTLAPEEEEKLRNEAMKTSAGRRALEAFGFLDQDFRGQIVHRLLEKKRAQDETTQAPLDTPLDDTRTEDALNKRSWPPPSRRRRWLPPAMALAASLMAVVGFLQIDRSHDVSSQGTGGQSSPSLDTTGPLPSYVMEIEGRSERRSADMKKSEPVLLVPGFRFEIFLQPKQSLPHAKAHVFVQLDGQGWQAWRAAEEIMEISDDGVILLEGVWGEELSLPAGDHTLAFVVGRKEALFSSHHILKILSEGQESGSDQWQLLREEVRVEGLEEDLHP